MKSRGVSDLYRAWYSAQSYGQPYRRDEEWLSFFDSVADHIVSDIGPSTVLDAGCVMGFLVESLRRQGVEAFGIDISEYAIQNVHANIRPYCWVGSVTDALAQEYDLIVCIEVLEHLSRREAGRAVENICQHSDDVLFSSTPLDYRETTHINVQPPEYWGELFARCGFFRDVDFDASFITPWAVRFRKTREPVTRVIAAYERRFWQLKRENQARRKFGIEQRNELAAKEMEVQALNVQVQVLSTQVRNWETRWADLEQTIGGALLQKLQYWRSRLAPPSSRRERWLETTFHRLRRRKRVLPAFPDQIVQVDVIQPRTPIQAHRATVELIICVHNALSDVRRCLESVVRHTTVPYSTILVDDGSDSQTRDYLSEFARVQEAVLLRNEAPRGYTRAANQGLRRSSADYVVLLNSDTVVTPEWLDRLVACAESNLRIGIVGPLSNTASWQSIPEIENHGDWATNPLPEGATIEQMARLVAQYSARLYPAMPFLNGFCLLIRRQLIRDIGYFDEETFGSGYGEENDYALRAGQAGWLLALADDAYVYHTQSRSYSTESRNRLTKRAGRLLSEKHGQQIIGEGVAFCQQDRVLEGIRARSRVMFARQDWVKKGRAKFAGRRVLFVLPISKPGGGGNVIIDEAMAMREMGVDVGIFNLIVHRDKFEQAYPTLEIPAIYGHKEDLSALAGEYDAVVATHNASVEWLAPITLQDGCPVRGYYVQGFEPYMYPSKTESFQRARDSYSLFPDLVRFTKTEWTRREVKKQTGVESTLVGISLNIDLFRPRPRSGADRQDRPDRPLRIAAMVRPDAPYREPKRTMELLRRASRRYGTGVEIVTFGVSSDDPGLAELPADFACKIAGVLTRGQIARLLNDVDIFVDFSSHQAMGLTALEAMACGAAVIVPERGGAVGFARHKENSLVVDTSSWRTCWRALRRLIEDRDLRSRLQKNALVDVVDFFPERSAFYILDALFGAGKPKAL